MSAKLAVVAADTPATAVVALTLPPAAAATVYARRQCSPADAFVAQ